MRYTTTITQSYKYYRFDPSCHSGRSTSAMIGWSLTFFWTYWLLCSIWFSSFTNSVIHYWSTWNCVPSTYMLMAIYINDDTMLRQNDKLYFYYFYGSSTKIRVKHSRLFVTNILEWEFYMKYCLIRFNEVIHSIQSSPMRYDLNLW